MSEVRTEEGTTFLKYYAVCDRDTYYYVYSLQVTRQVNHFQDHWPGAWEAMDLYGGLEESGRQEEIERLRSELESCKRSEKTLQTELNETKTQVIALNGDLRMMEDNMSTLFNTALLEVSRKNREIESLKLELIELRKNNTTLTESLQECEEIVRRLNESS